MRPITLFLASLAMVALSGACGAAAPAASTPPPPASATAPPAESQVPTISQPPASTVTPTAPPVVTQPPPTIAPTETPAPAGTNTITYEITGEYSASGTAIFDEAGSNFTEEGELGIFREGWTAYFDNEAEDHNIRLETRADDLGVEFFGGEVVVVASGNEDSEDECVFTITKNDASGPVGSAVCERAVLHPNGSTYVNLSIEWSVNL